MRTRHRVAGILSGLAFVLLATSAGPDPLASVVVFTGFEVDGNADSNGKDDWALLYNGGGSAFAYTGVICDYAFDPAPTDCGDGHPACECPVSGDDNVFLGGGSKDLEDISSWKATFKNNPPKDEIDNAYAAFYTDQDSPTKDLIAVFGADRLSTDGDAQIGFWFLQNDIQVNHTTGKFTGGVHAVNDVLILANFTKGGGVSTPKVYRWLGVNNLQDITASADATATVNTTVQSAPWAYEHHHAGRGDFQPGSFFEGRVNLTKALGSTLCFTTFLAETRSSQELTATLKDLVIGNIDVCAISVSKTCTCAGFTPDFSAFLIDFEATVTNTGAGSFPTGSTLTVTDDAGTPGNTADDVVVVKTLTDPLDNGESIQVTGQFQSTSNPPFNTVRAKITNSSSITEAEAFGTACEPCPLNPALLLTKTCELVLENKPNCGLVVKVEFEGSVKNTGNLPLFVTVTDTDATVPVLPLTLMMPGETKLLSGFYYPTQANGGITDPCQAMFSDTFTAVGQSPLLAQPVTEMITAHCPLCPCQ